MLNTKIMFTFKEVKMNLVRIEKMDSANCFAQTDKIKKLHEKLASLSLFTQHFCMPCFVFAKAVFLYCKIGNDLHISDLRDE